MRRDVASRSTRPSTSTARSDVIRRHLLPRLFAAGRRRRPSASAGVLRRSRGTRWRRPRSRWRSSTPSCAAPGVSLRPSTSARCATGSPCGVSVGIHDAIAELLDAVGGYLAEGYVRIKLKIEPGWDVEPVRAVRERFGRRSCCRSTPTPPTRSPTRAQLAQLDAFDLLLIEQPLAGGRRASGTPSWRGWSRTPICLDESITSARVGRRRDRARRVRDRQHQGRPGRRLPRGRAAIHDVCAAHGIPVWCGGMLETGLGRAANVALAALPGFTLPGDTSASDRYYAAGHHRAVRARRRPTRRAARARASA